MIAQIALQANHTLGIIILTPITLIAIRTYQIERKTK